MNLTWTIRRSFVDYVERSGGSVEASDGAHRSADGFVFETVESNAHSARYRGTVRFRAHGGLLDVIVADPQVRFEGAGGTIAVRASEDPSDPPVVLARVGEPDAAGAPQLRLTVDGARLLGDVYSPGELLDPFRAAGEDA
ncbi:HtaA domain-containing protein [Microbacterium sp. No. 7]|uniref:HtaA domain-containing protein n=1 Tax=Microbacterium sp. No. 7 TaxID=1714373 RepID=UPI0006D0F22D|nr:HtaA domain-containing protein [Microbacterium sp. No. 7]ALJ18453.1 hypothetical protein AOA12_00375 [Microbacterium sp. No. 7]